MFENENSLSLSDLMDVKLLQEFQDKFAKAMNVASIAVNHRGPITRASNFTDFCTKYTRNSALGCKNCIDCDIKWGKIAAERKEPVIYKCHTGLTDFAVPIIVNGKHVGSILGGQVLTEEPDERHFRKIAKQLKINEDEYITALKKIKIVPMENIEAAAQLLYLVANAVSEIGHKNFELYRKNKHESLFRIITGTIRSTLDIEETKKRIVNIIGQTLNADRCFIVEYDKKSDEFLNIKDEYLSSDKIDSYKEVDLNKKAPMFAKAFKIGKQIIINNQEFSLDANNENFDDATKLIQEYNIKSAVALPLLYGKELLGVLSIHYVNKNHFINEHETSLLNAISNQIVIAIHHATLYEITKRQASHKKSTKKEKPNTTIPIVK